MATTGFAEVKKVDMQLIYVVDLDVEGEDAFARVRGHVADWLSHPGDVLDPQDLATSGSRHLPTAKTKGGSFLRSGEWEVLAPPGHRALKLIVTQDTGNGVEVSTRVTLTEIRGRVHCRVGISRGATGSRLVPVGVTQIFQPGLLGLMDRDPHLTLRAGGQIVSREYLQIKTVDQGHALVDSIGIEARLPLVLIHVRSTITWDLARELAGKLLGMVRVVTLNFETARIVKNAHPQADVPFAGMTLVWPGMAAPPLRYLAQHLDGRTAEEVRLDLITRLGALAALGHGEDTEWRWVQKIVQEAHLSDLSREAAEARAGGNLAGEVQALQAKVEALETSMKEVEEIGEDALQQMEAASNRAKELEAERDRYREEAEMWKGSFTNISAGRATATASSPDVWSSIPALVPGSDPTEAFLAISDAASDRIAFTPRACKSWMDTTYPEPEDMADKLIRLAKAAVTLYDGEAKSLPRLDEWLKSEFGLNVALTDQTISKWKRKEMRWLNSFEHEGESLDATPHVKVRDAVKFNECGRIHFALDPAKDRLVVQHVGIKTYE